MVKPKNILYQFRGEVEVLSEQANAVPAIGVGCGVVGEWIDLKTARRRAEDYVACRGEYGSGMLFSLSMDGAAGRVDYRAARIFAKEVLEDGVEKIYELEDEYLDSLPRQVFDAFFGYGDVACRCGWYGSGWYAFEGFGADGVPVSSEEPQAVWYEGFYDWADDFAESFKDPGVAEVFSEYYGENDFPDFDVPRRNGSFNERQQLR